MLSMEIEYGPVEEMDDHCCACAVCRTGGERGSSKGRWFTEIPSQPTALGHGQTAAAPDGPGQCWRPDLHHGWTPGESGAYPPPICSLLSQIHITMLIQFHEHIMRANIQVKLQLDHKYIKPFCVGVNNSMTSIPIYGPQVPFHQYVCPKVIDD